MTHSTAAGSYTGAPQTILGSPFLREALLARLAAQHGAGAQCVQRTCAVDAKAWAEEAAAVQRGVARGERLLFDVPSRDHHEAYERACGHAAPALDAWAGTPLRAADLVLACDELDLAVVGVFPYGAIGGGIAGTRWLHHSLAGGQSWERVLSWVKRDRKFCDLMLFLEEIVHALTSDVTGRFVLVLENRSDPQANAAWRTRNSAFRAALCSGFTRAAIEPFVGAACWEAWREGLRALRHPPSLIAAFRLLDVPRAWKYPIELAALLEPGVVEDLAFLAARKRADDAMWDFIMSLQEDPELAPFLRPRPDIAAHFEFDFLRPLANAVLKIT